MKIHTEYLVTLVMIVIATTSVIAQEEINPLKKVEDSVMNVTYNLAETWESLNADSYLNYFSKEVDFYIEGERVDFEFLKNSVTYAFQNLAETTFEISNPKISYSRIDQAVISFNLKETFLDKQGNYEELKGALTLVWVHGIDGWKIILAHESIPQLHPERK